MGWNNKGGRFNTRTAHLLKKVKRWVWKRDNYICQYCQKDLSGHMIDEDRRMPYGDITVDHIKPLIKGGDWWHDNLVTCCSKCNKMKGSKTIETNSSSKGKVVVVGGAGFIGSNITKALLENGYVVRVVDNLAGGKASNIPKEAQFFNIDIRKLDDLKVAFAGADYVFHLAALPRVQYSIENPEVTHDVNVTGTLNVLMAAKFAKVKRVIYSASSSAYGDQKIMPVHEAMTPNPMSPYAAHKYMGEVYCKTWSLVYGLETVCLRYFNVYGTGQSDEGAYALVIAKFLKQKREGKKMTITGDGTQTRDFTNVFDVVQANLLAMKSEKVGKGEVINIGAGNNVSVNTIASLIGGETEYIEKRFEPKDTLASIKKAGDLLDWFPIIPIEQGIAMLKDEEAQRKTS